MSIFRGRGVESEPVAELSSFNDVRKLGGVACGPEYCAEEDPDNLELSQHEEELVESLCDIATVWAEDLAAARHVAIDVQSKLLNHNEGIMRQGAQSRQDMREGVKNVQQHAATQMVKFRDTAVADVNRVACRAGGGESVFGIAMGGNAGKISRATATLIAVHDRTLAKSNAEAPKRTKLGKVHLYGETVVSPYHRVFTSEAIAKLRLASLMSEYPKTAATMLSPANLVNLPDSLQQLIATDIANDQKSLVLNFMLVKMKKELSFYEYLNENSITTSAKEYARSINLGARALGACECPMNAAGICRSVADRVAQVELPKDVSDDMQRKQAEAARRLTSQLHEFARRNKVSDWWSMEPEITAYTTTRQTPGLNTKKSVRQRSSAPINGNAGTPKSFADSLTEPVKKEIQPPSRVFISQSGVDRIHGVEHGVEADQEAAIDSILASKKFADYIKHYQHDKALVPFLRAAISTIMFAPTYKDAPGLVKVGYRSTQPHITSEGDRLARYRLSGKEYRGYSGDAVWSTRISFAANNGNGTRRVEIIGIDHKTKIEKAGLSGKFFTKK